MVLFVVPILLVPSTRVLARLTVGFVVAVLYETLSVSTMGATPGKQIAGIRVGRLGRAAVDPQAALRRAMLSAFITLGLAWLPLVVVGNTGSGDGDRLGVGISASFVAAFIGLCAGFSALTSPLRRGFADRTAGTVVLDRRAPADFGVSQLAERAARHTPVQTNPAGPAASFERRRRARASRLDDTPVLVLLIVALGFALSVPHLSGWLLGLLALVWEVAFVADETWRISRAGATAGHRRFGLAVVDRRTGEAPGPMQAVTRAILVSLPLYVLPTSTIAAFAGANHNPVVIGLGALAAVLVFTWLIVMRFVPGRSFHDFAARTTVVVIAEAEIR